MTVVVETWPRRVYALVEIFPNPYRPYIDAQFAALIEPGCDVRIFAGRAWPAVHHFTHAWGLPERTRYYPTGLREAVRPFHGDERASLGSLWRWRRLLPRVIASRQPGAALALARQLVLPAAPPDFFVVHDAWIGARFPLLREAYPGVPIVLFHHGNEPSTVSVRSAVSTAFRDADLVFTNTEASRRQVVARGCPEEKVRVLPVGVRTRDHPDPAARVYRPDGSLRLASVGRLVEEKGLEFALEALARLRRAGRDRFEYRIIGTGPRLDALRERTAELGLAEHVHFLGHLASDRLFEELVAADALLLPSITTETAAETQALVVQEAMLARCAAVTTRVGGVPESIPLEMQALCVAERDPDALGAAIGTLMDVPAEELAALGAAGRRFVLDRYDVDRVTACMVDHVRAMAVGALSPS